MSKKVIQGVGHVFYPDSCPVDNVIEHIFPRFKVCMSPIHNRDLDKNGTLKKAHYHLLFIGNLSQADKNYISKITTMKYFEPIYCFDGAYHYLYHWDKKTDWYLPDKAHYWSADIKRSDLFEYESDSNNSSDNYPYLLFDLLQMCTGFADFFRYVRDLEDMDFFSYCLSKNTFINNYYRSCDIGSRVSDSDRIKSKHIREKNDYFVDDYNRIKYSAEVDLIDNNPFIGFKSVD